MQDMCIFPAVQKAGLLIHLFLEFFDIKEVETLGPCMEELLYALSSLIVEKWHHVTELLHTAGNVRLASYSL